MHHDVESAALGARFGRGVSAMEPGRRGTLGFASAKRSVERHESREDGEWEEDKEYGVAN